MDTKTIAQSISRIDINSDNRNVVVTGGAALPPEIVTKIVHQVMAMPHISKTSMPRPNPDLLSGSLVCRSWSSVFQSFLCRNVSLSSRRRLRAFLRGGILEHRYVVDQLHVNVQDNEDLIEELNEMLRRVEGLKHLENEATELMLDDQKVVATLQGLRTWEDYTNFNGTRPDTTPLHLPNLLSFELHRSHQDFTTVQIPHNLIMPNLRRLDVTFFQLGPLRKEGLSIDHFQRSFITGLLRPHYTSPIGELGLHRILLPGLAQKFVFISILSKSLESMPFLNSLVLEFDEEELGIDDPTAQASEVVVPFDHLLRAIPRTTRLNEFVLGFKVCTEGATLDVYDKLRMIGEETLLPFLEHLTIRFTLPEVGVDRRDELDEFWTIVDDSFRRRHLNPAIKFVSTMERQEFD